MLEAFRVFQMLLMGLAGIGKAAFRVLHRIFKAKQQSIVLGGSVERSSEDHAFKSY